ncbi:MAG: hypothetical protein J7L12_00125 [Desulfurococcales archaeon]|nr:hypothetical protein [Desulfurococcales archaeon]
MGRFRGIFRIILTLVCILLTLSTLSLTAHYAAHAQQPTSPMQRERVFSYTVTEWDGWVFEVVIKTRSPWIVGSEVLVNVTVRIMEAPPNTTLSITKVGILTDTLEYSKYLGIFRNSGERRSVTFSILLIDPEYAKLKPGEYVSKVINVKIEGYVEGNGEKLMHSFLITFPVDVYVLPSYIKLDVTAPAEVKLGDYIQLGVTVKNTGAAPVYGVTISIYDGGRFVDEKFVSSLSPGGVASVFSSFKPREEGVHNIIVRASWIYQSGGNGTTISTVRILVKRSIEIIMYSNVSKVNAFNSVEIRGSVRPSLSNITLNIEGSMDGGFTWIVLGKVVTDNTGNFKFVWTPTKPGSYIVRTRFLGSEFYYEAVSNTIIIEVLKGKPKITLTASSASIKAGEKVKLKIEVSPPAKLKLSLMYRIGEQEWKQYSAVSTNDKGVAETLFIPIVSGTYHLKAIFNGDKYLAPAESNIITIRVSEKKVVKNITTTTGKASQNVPLLSEEMMRYIVMGAIGGSAALSVLMWMRWRRR